MTSRTDLTEPVAWCGALPVPLGHTCPLTPASPIADLVAQQRQQRAEEAANTPPEEAS